MRKDPRERATVSSLLKHPFVEHSRKLAVPRVLRGIIQSQRAANLADLRHASKEAIAPNPRAGETPAKLPMEEGDVRVLHGGRFDAKLPAIPESGRWRCERSHPRGERVVQGSRCCLRRCRRRR